MSNVNTSTINRSLILFFSLSVASSTLEENWKIKSGRYLPTGWRFSFYSKWSLSKEDGYGDYDIINVSKSMYKEHEKKQNEKKWKRRRRRRRGKGRKIEEEWEPKETKKGIKRQNRRMKEEKNMIESFESTICRQNLGKAHCSITWESNMFLCRYCTYATLPIFLLLCSKFRQKFYIIYIFKN